MGTLAATRDAIVSPGSMTTKSADYSASAAVECAEYLRYGGSTDRLEVSAVPVRYPSARRDQ